MDTHILELGRILIHNENGAAILLQDGIISMSGIIAFESCLIKTKSRKYSPIMFGDVRVGRLNNIVYTKSNHKLTSFFTIFEGGAGDYIYDNQEKFLVSPMIRAEKITCPMCNTTFSKGQSRCDCIGNGKLIIIDDFEVTGARLYDSSDGMQDMGVKNSILAEFFGGAVANLIITEEI